MDTRRMLGIATLLIALLAPALTFGDLADGWVDRPVSNSIHSPRSDYVKFHLAVGGGIRTDEPDYLSGGHTFRSTLYFNVATDIALSAGFGIERSDIASSSRIANSTLGDIGVRFQSPRGVISPYLMTGISLYRYTVEGSWYRVADTRAGFVFGLGASTRIAPGTWIDFGLRHIMNDVDVGRDVVTIPPLRPDADPWPFGYYYSTDVPDGLLNPTTFEIALRIALL